MRGRTEMRMQETRLDSRWMGGHSVVDGKTAGQADLIVAALREGEVHVWSARLDLPREPIQRLERLLNPEEAARASRFHFARDRDAFAVARGVLRTLLGRYLGERPEKIRFACGPYGKPV